ncbi:MAG: DUF5683 domain-containing protein [bacterium]|nr:DUF5683 domain-containing protein [bacterium]
MKILGFLVLFLWTLTPFADEIPDSALEAAAGAYDAGDFDQAVRQLENLPGLLGIVPKLDGIRKKTRAQIFLDLGRIYLAAGDTGKARVALSHVFALDSSAKEGLLDLRKDRPYEETLKFLSVLKRKQKQLELNATSKWQALVRSALVPGWGQIYRGHKTRGYVVLGVAAALTVNWLTARQAYQSALQDYQRTSLDDLQLSVRQGTSSDLSPFAERFERTQSRADRANLALSMLVGIWLAGVTDSVVIGPRQLAISFSID